VSEIPQLLKDRTAVVFGVANRWSIAWAVAKRLAEAGAKVLMTYQDDRFADKVLAMAGEVPNCQARKCDLTKPEDVDSIYNGIEEDWGGLDTLVHSVAYALREDLDGRFSDTSAEGFRIAHEISAYTLVAAARGARPLMEKRGGGSVMAMTYHGSERVIPNYNIMGVAKASLEACVRYLASDLGPQGIRVNALSPGPISTSAARGIAGFTSMLQYARERAPMRRNTDTEEVADAALFLASDLARGITGEVIHVDCGYHITGM
jgi:enoyl-[acyl-carrier protein] reductase I